MYQTTQCHNPEDHKLSSPVYVCRQYYTNITVSWGLAPHSLADSKILCNSGTLLPYCMMLQTRRRQNSQSLPLEPQIL